MVILIGIGAGLGAVCRYGITVLGKMFWPGKPMATLLINVLGSLLAGLLVGLPTLSAFRLFLLPGLCGGFTTFSTFTADAFILIKNRQWSMAIFYYVGTVVVGMVAVVLGMVISNVFFDTFR
ncbi:CrcB family protein [Lacticaseibacillus paracasei]|uniref:fluoride efflux transporter FluC n=1 Tax=Lacticaseibacillus paracasei TaxID=1597 RepID=UPI002FE24E26